MGIDVTTAAPDCTVIVKENKKMAKSNTTPTVVPSKAAAAKPAPAAPATSTPVRNSAIPPRPATPGQRKAPTHEQIARRAYEISQSGRGGTQDENWFRAERELRGF